LLKHTAGENNLFHEAHAALVCLYEPAGPLDDPNVLVAHALQAARSAPNVTTAKKYYKPLLEGWSWKRTEEEIHWLKKNNSVNVVPLRLFEAWVAINHSTDNFFDMFGYFENNELVKEWPELWSSKLFNKMPVREFKKYPLVISNYLDALALHSFTPQPMFYLEIASEHVLSNKELQKKQAFLFGEILFRQLSHKERKQFFEKNISRDSQFVRLLFDQIGGAYLPADLPTLTDWLHWFGEYVENAAPQIPLQVIKTVLSQSSYKKIMSLLPENSSFLKQLTTDLLANPNYVKEANKIWFDFCKKHPENIPFYVAVCLQTKALPPEFVEELFVLLLEQDDLTLNSTLSKINDDLPVDIDIPNQLVSLLLELQRLLQILNQSSEIAEKEKLDFEHFKNISSVFEPEKNIHRADMMVSLITCLRQHLVRSWLTPVSFLVEALTYGERYMEAQEIVNRHPGLRVGPQKLYADKFLGNFAKKNPDFRNRSSNEIFYNRVIQQEIDSWVLSL
jgi:hypothetical protein